MTSELRRLCLLSVAVALLSVPEALAESRPDRTGTNGGPNTTITAPNTNALGVTKPPGVEEAAPTSQERRELQQIDQQDKRIEKDICDGCGR